MLNISRWTKVEVCYKTIKRFYSRTIPWLEMNLLLIMQLTKGLTMLVASDETLSSKSGKKTTGIDFFFSSIYQKPIKSLCFSGLSIIIPDKKKSYPLLMSQLIFTPEEKQTAKLKKEKTKISKSKKAGRPKGSKNTKEWDKPLAAKFRLLKEQLTSLKAVLKV